MFILNQLDEMLQKLLALGLRSLKSYLDIPVDDPDARRLGQILKGFIFVIVVSSLFGLLFRAIDYVWIVHLSSAEDVIMMGTVGGLMALCLITLKVINRGAVSAAAWVWVVGSIVGTCLWIMALSRYEVTSRFLVAWFVIEVLMISYLLPLGRGIMMGFAITVIELTVLSFEFRLGAPSFVIQVFMINTTASVLASLVRGSFDHLYKAHEERVRELHDLRTMLFELVIDYAREMNEIGDRAWKPANMLAGTVKVLKASESERISQKGLEALQAMEKYVEEIVKLADDVQHSAESLVDQNEWEVESFSLSHLIQSLVDDFSHVARRKNLRLRCVLDPHLPNELHGYPGTLLYVMRKLVGTAILLTPEGEVSVGVRQSAQGWWTVRVNNVSGGASVFGQALDVESVAGQVESILPHECKRGLRLVRELVVSMGGTVSTESQGEKGSSYVVNIPMSPASLGGIPAFNQT
jgi:signal transduction histidine kinase